MKKRGLSILLACVMLLSVTLLLAGCSESVPPQGTFTRMTVDINPSIEFMIDDQNKVVAVTALNDDGSILIAGEAFVGKTPEAAAELVIRLAGETGYLISGSVQTTENEVKISVSGDTAYAQKLKEKVETKAAEALKAMDIEGKVARVEAMRLEQLRQLAMESGLFTDEEVAAMTEQQLYSALAASRVETALLLTEQMRQAYYAAKESQISFAQSQATAQIIEAMGAIYQPIALTYKLAVDTYSKAITAIDEFRYEKLVSPESDYQKNLAALREAKAELLQQKNYVARLEVNGEEYASASLQLQLSQEQYDAILTAYEALGTQLNDALVLLIENLRASEEVLRSMEDKFSDNIQQELQAKADALENAVNEAKDQFFAEFEAAHKEDILSMEQQLIAQKELLKENAVAKQ